MQDFVVINLDVALVLTALPRKNAQSFMFLTLPCGPATLNETYP